MAASSTPVGIGIIGNGLAASFHARAIRAVPAARLVAVLGRQPDRAAAFAAEFAAVAMTDLDAFLARPDIEAVCICVPSGRHADYGIAAARAGKHLLVEKPLDVTLTAADQLIAACQAQGVVLAGVSQHRFNPDVIRVRETATRGGFGSLIFGGAFIPWYRPQAYYDRGGWRGTWTMDGGGCLINQGIHTLDLLQWIMGPVATVTAHATTAAHQIEVEDLVVAILRFHNGALGLVQGSTAIYPGLPERLEISGTHGTAIVTGGRLTTWALMEAASAERPAPEPQAVVEPVASGAGDPAAISISGHIAQIDDFVRAIREQRPPAIPGADARQALAFVLALYQSAREGREVALPLTSA